MLLSKDYSPLPGHAIPSLAFPTNPRAYTLHDSAAVLAAWKLMSIPVLLGFLPSL